MKKVILGLALAAMIISCKKETKEEVKEGTEAVGTEMKEEMDTVGMKMDTVGMKTKAEMDTVKNKMGSAMEKSGEKMKEEGKEMKEHKK